ncbi:MAG: hypothetical protein QM535_10185 [Limnohabitans sp.]|nr:hypothetical protein [Limnohabitans sp.]
MKKLILKLKMSSELTKTELKAIKGAGFCYYKKYYGYTKEDCLNEGGRFHAIDNSCSIYTC